MSVESAAWEALAGGESLEADLIVFPSRYLGELCERGWLRPVRESLLASADYNAGELFPLVRQRLATYGKRDMAVPLGVDLPVMCFRVERFEAPRQVPATWAAYLELLASESQLDGNRQAPVAWEPFESWGAALLLARIASYAVHADNASVLFDAEDMAPRITEPPFVRALEELRRAAELIAPAEETNPSDGELTSADAPRLKPRAASWRLAGGRATHLAIGSPPAGGGDDFDDGELPADGDPAQIGWTSLPGAGEVYKVSASGWQTERSIRRVPVLGLGDRLAAVSASSRNAASAFQLLEWLAKADVSSQIAGSSKRMLPVRRSLAASPSWYDERLAPRERSDLAEVLNEALNSENCLIIPRIQGIDEYLAALDRAVRSVLANGAEPPVALQAATDEWDLLTDRIGRERQLRAYHRHLGF